MAHSDPVVIVGALRTPIGNFNGSLSSLPASALGAAVIKALLARTGIPGKDISEVIMGQVLTAACGQNPARQAAIKAGLPDTVPAMTINQVCGSGLRAVALGMQAILAGESTIVIAGGQESMSQAPHAIPLREGIKMGDGNLKDTMITDGLWDIFNNYHMGMTAENVAEKFAITRTAQDNFACTSQQKAEAAQKAGLFKEEITPITVPSRKGDVTVGTDEFPRHGTTVENLSKLRAVFTKEGTVTAGNASGINDGAAAVVLMSASEAKKRKLTPLAIIRSFAHSGVAPEIMGTGPIPATEKALQKAGWTVNDLDVIEANEAFAAQALAVNQALHFPSDKINPLGGAIALGHPIGASGTRILVTLLHSLQRQKAHKGLCTLCVGGGMGVALCVERTK